MREPASGRIVDAIAGCQQCPILLLVSGSFLRPARKQETQAVSENCNPKGSEGNLWLLARHSPRLFTRLDYWHSSLSASPHHHVSRLRHTAIRCTDFVILPPLVFGLVLRTEAKNRVLSLPSLVSVGPTLAASQRYAGSTPEGASPGVS